MYILHDADITALSQIIHIEVVCVFHLIAPLLFDAKVLGDDDPDIKILFIKAFWQGAHYVCQSSCFNKRHCF